MASAPCRSTPRSTNRRHHHRRWTPAAQIRPFPRRPPASPSFSGAASPLCRSCLGRAPSPGCVRPCRCRASTSRRAKLLSPASLSSGRYCILSIPLVQRLLCIEPSHSNARCDDWFAAAPGRRTCSPPPSPSPSPRRPFAPLTGPQIPAASAPASVSTYALRPQGHGQATPVSLLLRAPRGPRRHSD